MERVTLPQRDGEINIWKSLKRLLIFGKTSGARSFVSGRAKHYFGKPGGPAHYVVAASMFDTH